MEHYSKNQVEILKKLSKSPIDLSDIMQDQEAMKPFRFLQKEGLISLGYKNEFVGRPYIASIEEKGEAYLECLKIDERRFKIPLFFSGLAAIVSVVSLLVSIFS